MTLETGQNLVTTTILILGLILQTSTPPEPAHAKNPVYAPLLREGFPMAGETVKLPAPMLADGLDADAEHKALAALAGSDRALDEMARDSISAPILVKTHDKKLESGTIRLADVSFFVRADFKSIKLDQVSQTIDEQKPVEAGNMRFTMKRLTPDDLKARGLSTNGGDGEWYLHATARLLDRINVQATDRVVATRSDVSWVVASRTEDRLKEDATYPNRWNPITREGVKETNGVAKPYEGGAGYVKLSKLASIPGTLFVEAHFAFFEPKAWFDGAPILRSKISLIAQDRIRKLRRELKTSQPKD